LVVSAALVVAIGVSMSLQSRDRADASRKVLVPLIVFLSLSALPFVWPTMASALVAATTMSFQTWVSLISYDDLHALDASSAATQFTAVGIPSASAAWLVMTVAGAGLAAQVLGAVVLIRNAVRGFDAAVGRRVRPSLREPLRAARAPNAR
jgi:hypothetical protein